uniref:Uncharacterized protein n=1 Tax=Lactuca sativa TaxID=4236 RepID=A0A9R1W7Z4_LACSA|nr:hypothetical protein LSAT_V11C300134520 [Lactuca sativa]
MKCLAVHDRKFRVVTVEEENLYEFRGLHDKTSSNDEESNEVIFYGMPHIPDCPDPIVEPGPFHSLVLKEPEKSFSLSPNILTKIVTRYIVKWKTIVGVYMQNALIPLMNLK